MADNSNRSFVVPTLGCVTSAQVQDALQTCEDLLMRSENCTPIVLTREWAKRFPTDAGVYAVFDDGNLIYVGETGRISARMTDLLDSRNHVLRRNIGNRIYAEEDGFRRASAHQRFPDRIEVRLKEYIETRLAVAAVVVPLGRAEIEEHMKAKYRPLYNNKGKRGTTLHGQGDGND